MSTNDALQTTDCRRLNLDGRQIILIGTAHISQQSVDTVRQAIELEQPDAVCVELDQQRFQALQDRQRWRNLNLVQALRRGQGPYLLANLALASFQRRMGRGTGVQPGAELAAAAAEAEQRDLPLHLVDREIRTTLLRVWRKTGWWKKMHLLTALLAGLFDGSEIDEEQLARLRDRDTLTALLDEMGDALPIAKQTLVDERDQYMAARIAEVPGQKILAVVGAAHVDGICRHLQAPLPAGELAELDRIPPRHGFSRLLPWLVPGLVMALFAFSFFYGDRSRLTETALAWVLAHGLLSALGAAGALGHPLAVAAAFIAAPFTSLNPAIGAGFVSGTVQAMLAGPTVQDLESINDSLATMGGWWRNRLTRVLLVFFLSNLGSALGTLVAFGWLKNLI